MVMNSNCKIRFRKAYALKTSFNTYTKEILLRFRFIFMDQVSAHREGHRSRNSKQQRKKNYDDYSALSMLCNSIEN